MDVERHRLQAQPLNYLSSEQMDDFHFAALSVLEQVGTVVKHEQALQLLRSAGAVVSDEQRVFLSASLVEWAIKQAPSRSTVYDRTGKPAMYLEGRNVNFGTGSDCPYILDHQSGQRRSFHFQDVKDAVRLVDALPNIDFCMCMGLAPDIDTKVQDQYKYAAMLRYSTKPQVVVAGNRQSLEDIAQMAASVRGGMQELARRPLFVLYNEPTSPLVHSPEAMDKLLFMAENRLPTNYAPGIMAGGTAPVTIAGAMTQALAEILTGLVIHQLKNPGAPFVFGGGMSPMDMSSMQPTYAAPEAMMAEAGLVQIGRQLYKMPTWGFTGCSASKLPDEQAAHEASSYLQMSGSIGTNLAHDVGYLEFGLTFSFELLAMCNEFIAQNRRLMQGIRVDPEYMALEAIKRVDAGGHYLGDEHTFTHFQENYKPELTDRRTFEDWQAQGGTSMRERACKKVDSILSTHETVPLTKEAEESIQEVMSKAEERN